MTQDRNNQTTNENNNIIEQVDEQELQDISGGCLGCGVVSWASAYDAGTATKKAMQTASLKEATKGAAYGSISRQAISSFSSDLKPCQNCVQQGAKYIMTKIISS